MTLARPFAFGLLLGLAHAALPASAQTQSAGPAEGLRTRSPPSVLNDPLVKRCRLLAARRTDPKIPDSMTTAVETAGMRFDLEPVLDAVAVCRAALAVYPGEPDVIIPHFTASDMLQALVLGIKFPDSQEEAFNLALKADFRSSPLLKKVGGFFLGSAYEYGIGTKPDRQAAMKWYAFAADAGDPISRRELQRLQSAAR